MITRSVNFAFRSDQCREWGVACLHWRRPGNGGVIVGVGLIGGSIGLALQANGRWPDRCGRHRARLQRSARSRDLNSECHRRGEQLTLPPRPLPAPSIVVVIAAPVTAAVPRIIIAAPTQVRALGGLAHRRGQHQKSADHRTPSTADRKARAGQVRWGLTRSLARSERGWPMRWLTSSTGRTLRF